MNGLLSEFDKARLAAIRSMLDMMVDEIGAADEASFNAKAAEINKKAAAIPVWREDKDYKRGAMAIDPADGVPYWAIHDQGPGTGQVHRPSVSPTMWAHCHGTTPETAREFVAESYNPYNEGHYCVSKGAVWRCKVNSCVYAPDAWPDAWEAQVEEIYFNE